MINRFLKHYRALSLVDFIRHLLRYAARQAERLLMRTGAIRSFMYFKRWDVQIGSNVIIRSNCYNVHIGDGFEIYPNVVLEVGHKASLNVGDHCLLSYGVIVQCMESVRLGNFVQVGEYTSIRDTSHSYADPIIPMKYQPDFSKGIEIGNNVWIGRGCIILPGSKIEEGVVVGANSVVKGRLERNGIYVGSPTRLIKFR